MRAYWWRRPGKGTRTVRLSPPAIPRPGVQRGVPHPASYGIHRYLRHPIYLGVILESVTAPLLQSAYLTAVAFSVATLPLLILSARIQTEDTVLLDAGSRSSALSFLTLGGIQLNDDLVEDAD